MTKPYQPNIRITSKSGYHPDSLLTKGTPKVDETANWANIFFWVNKAIQVSEKENKKPAIKQEKE